MTGTAGLFNIANAAPPLVPQSGTNAISGGLLRPGSIDQQAFVQMLRSQEANRQAAGVGGTPVDMPLPVFQTGKSAIPTLSSAQFAALVGRQSPAVGDDAGGDTADSQAASGTAAPYHAGIPTPLPVAAVRAAAAPLPQAAALRVSGAPPIPTPALPEGQAEGTISEDAPAIFRKSANAATETAATAPPEKSAAAGAASSAPPAPTPPVDPNVVHLKDAPDRDTQRTLMAEHKRWVVDETPGARQLFFGPDGKFGWDDFLDVINPLQHIPIIAQLYRAATGDTISGAAELIGAIPFGPLGAISMMGAIADIAVKDVTGKDVGDNVASLLFGDGNGAADNVASRAGGKQQDNSAAVQGTSDAVTQVASLDGDAAYAPREDVRGTRR